MHDPKARTSTALRGCQKLRSEKLWAEFSFPNILGGGGLPTRWPRVLCAESKEHKHFRPGARPGGSVTGLTEKLFMCQMFIGCRLRGCTATQRSKKGSEKVLGRVLGKGFSEGF